MVKGAVGWRGGRGSVAWPWRLILVWAENWGFDRWKFQEFLVTTGDGERGVRVEPICRLRDQVRERPTETRKHEEERFVVDGVGADGLCGICRLSPGRGGVGGIES